jgi:hypothetical protein
MKTATTCSWCHELNAAGVPWCKACGHAADRERANCGCRRCTATWPEHPAIAETANWPAVVTGVWMSVDEDLIDERDALALLPQLRRLWRLDP